MAYPYFTQQQLEDRIGAHMLRRVCDDDGSGVAKASVVTRLRTDASSITRGYLKGCVPSLDDIATTTPDEIVQLAIDVAVALMAMRSPEVMLMNGQSLRNRAEADCKAFRENRRGAAGVTAENEGGDFVIGNPSDWNEDEAEPVFLWGTSGF